MRVALAVEYDGSAFCGWQRQRHCHSVQAELEAALTQIAQQSITVHCAGRTDAGVHAAAQVVHFDTDVARPMRAWSFGVNSHLDKHVAVHWASLMRSDFHARFKALNRSYRYSILNRSTRAGLHSNQLAWQHLPLDAERMHVAAQVLLGEHDFSSFRSADCQANHAVRHVQRISVARSGALVTIEITANGFLHNMVRIIAGCLMSIGKGEQAPDWMASLLDARDRTLAGITAAPQGLCFLQPDYPPEFGIPDFQAESSTLWHPD